MGFLKNIFAPSNQAKTNIPDDAKVAAGKMGERLGILISALFSETDRPRVLAALEEMTPEQLFDFYRDLEKRFQEAAIAHDQALDQAYAQEVGAVQSEHQVREEIIKNQALSELESLEQELTK